METDSSGGQISKENLYLIKYYKDGFMSNNI
jgi:hypothetical protein